LAPVAPTIRMCSVLKVRIRRKASDFHSERCSHSGGRPRLRGLSGRPSSHEGRHDPGSRWWPSCIRRTGLCYALQQMRDRTDARVRYEPNHACASGTYGDAVRLCENRIRSCDLQRSSEGIAPQHQKPGFSFRLQTPCGVRRQVDPSSTKWPETRSTRWSVKRFGRTRKGAGPAFATAIARSM
jgi:hypothetical protein